MPRLPLVDPDDPSADPSARALLQRVRELRGRALNVYRPIANHPEVLDGVLAFGVPPGAGRPARARRGVIELCLTVGMANMTNRFHATFHTDVDDDTADALGVVCPVRLPPGPGEPAAG